MKETTKSREQELSKKLAVRRQYRVEKPGPRMCNLCTCGHMCGEHVGTCVHVDVHRLFRHHFWQVTERVQTLTYFPTLYCATKRLKPDKISKKS